ncbi:MAG TPA: transporter substrate-binding domain-containing protein [Ramlibacter sp.]|nr:transporter substrate-binding domain-containing protein [Ramlibacter sp.]
MKFQTMRWPRWLRAAAVGVCALAATGWACADALDDIHRRGKLVVGVKQDVPLWGQVNRATGALEGLEPDLAADLAQRLGVQLELVGVLTAERIEAVQTRRVDVLIATLSDTPDRRERMTLVMPHYYASGVNILARSAENFADWKDLRNRRVCGRRGAFYNRAITVTYDIDVVALYSNKLSMAALRDGRCDALLYDDTNIVALLQDPAWSKTFTMPLETLYTTPWAIAVHKSESGGRLEATVSQAVLEWHRRGYLVELERKWGIPVSAFTTGMNKAWNRRHAGGFRCGNSVAPHTPKDCL